MASIRARSDTGQLFIDFRWQGRRVRRQTTLTDTPSNRARLAKVLKTVEEQIAAGTFDFAAFFPDDQRPAPIGTPLPAQAQVRSVREPTSAASPLLRDFVDQWVKEHEVEWRRSHMRTLMSTIHAHLLPSLGDKRVAEISRADVLAFRATLATKSGRRVGQRLSNKRINGVMGPLKQIMNEAADRFGFPSPTANIKPLKIRKSDVQPFSLKEVEAILSTVRPDYRDYLLVRFFTGMRSGEIDGLKWKYVDFDRRLILVREAFVLGEDEYTKTDGSQRDIKMSTPVLEALRRQASATSRKSEYVFCNQLGRPIDNKNFTDRVWRPLLRHLGLEIRRPYQMRHTAATLWLAAGENPEWIARQLGHSNTQMLFNVYSRFVPNMTRQDGAAIERLLEATLQRSPTETCGPQPMGIFRRSASVNSI